MTRKIFISFLFIFTALGCNSSIATVENSNNLNGGVSKQGYEVISVIPKKTMDYDLYNKFKLFSDSEFLIFGGWEAKSKLYRFSKDMSIQSVNLPKESPSLLMGDMFFINSQIGWIVGDEKILKTDDGGKSWLVSSPKYSKITRFFSIAFFNENIGYAAGTTGFMNKSTYKSVQGLEILCTSDGGSTWKVCYNSRKFNNSFNIVTFSEKDAAILVDGTHLLFTTNKGVNWQDVTLNVPTKEIVAGIDGKLYRVNNDGIQYSSDLGIKWKNVNFDKQIVGNKLWNSISFDKNGTGIAIRKDGLIATTKENGINWFISDIKLDDELLTVEVKNSYAIIMGIKNVYVIEFK